MNNNMKASFDSLAPELLDTIFSQLASPRDLMNIIMASKTMLEYFTVQKEVWIYQALQNQLGPVLTEAEFLIQFPYANHIEDKNLHCRNLHDKIETYLAMQKAAEESKLIGRRQPPSMEDLATMCHTFYAIDALFNSYRSTYLYTYTQGDEHNAIQAPLSATERLRILRAIYRRQILCNAWGDVKRRPAPVSIPLLSAFVNPVGDLEQYQPGFYAAWQPWERQQIECAETFILKLCVELDQRAVEIDEPISKVEFGNIVSQVTCLVDYAKGHRIELQHVLKYGLLRGRRVNEQDDSNSHPTTHRHILNNVTPPLTYRWQAEHVLKFPDWLREYICTNFYFPGQAKIKFEEEGLEKIPFAWVDVFDGHDTPWFGSGLSYYGGKWFGFPADESPEPYFQMEISKPRLTSKSLWRAAGFVFWDRERVEALKSHEELSALNPLDDQARSFSPYEWV